MIPLIITSLACLCSVLAVYTLNKWTKEADAEAAHIARLHIAKIKILETQIEILMDRDKFFQNK